MDSSALIAVMRAEPDAAAFTRAVEAVDRSALSAATYLETSIVVTEPMHVRFDELVEAMGLEIVAVDAEQARAARVAYARYGRGSGSPARLNFGDCFAYALAKVRDEPLLFKGDDFSHTDVRPALPPG